MSPPRVMARAEDVLALFVASLLGAGCNEAMEPGRDGGPDGRAPAADASRFSPPSDGGGPGSDAGPTGIDAVARMSDATTPRDAVAPPRDAVTPPRDAVAPPADVPVVPTTAYFPAGAPWTTDVSTASVDPLSSTVIPWLQTRGWGGGRMRIDFSIEVLSADAATPLRTFATTDDFFDPDCDHVPMPVPAGGALEGETGYACAGDGDCHLIVVNTATRRLYEMWRADIRGTTFNGGCLATWDLSRIPLPSGRGEQCSSADAAGLPIAPLLFNADEVSAASRARGSLSHAIRFILPNDRIRSAYQHPGSHGTRAATGGASAPPYGARFRLRADFPLATLPNEGARVIARTLQRYGMYLADGGTITLTAQSDRFTTASWAGLLGASDLTLVQVQDFAMVDGGAPIAVTNNCVRNP
jgi:hypothetical protein